MIYVLLAFLILAAAPVWAEEESMPAEPAAAAPEAVPAPPLLSLTVNGSSATVPRTDRTEAELLYVCKRQQAQDCAGFLTQVVADAITLLIRQTKAGEREQACSNFKMLDRSEQETILTQLGGISPCRE